MQQQSVHGTDLESLTEYYRSQSNFRDDAKGARAAAHAVWEEINYTGRVAVHLREINKQAKAIYTQHADTAQIQTIVDPVDWLTAAKSHLEAILKSKTFGKTDMVRNGGIQSDIEAIEKRMLPFLGKSGEFKNVIAAYLQETPERLATARRGVMPEGVDKVERVELSLPTEQRSAVLEKQREEGSAHKMHVYNKKNYPEKYVKAFRAEKPDVISEPRPVPVDEDGKTLKGIQRYQHFKTEEAKRLTTMSEVAEKTRTGEGPAWEQRIDAAKQGKSSEEPQR